MNKWIDKNRDKWNEYYRNYKKDKYQTKDAKIKKLEEEILELKKLLDIKGVY